MPGSVPSPATAPLPAPAPAAPQAQGWPAGSDAAQSLDELAAHLRKTVDEFVEMHESSYYPTGWSKMRRVVSDVTVERHEAAGKQTAIVHVTYVKHFSRMHKLREDAAKETELLPASPGPTFESMRSSKNVQSEPMELALSYELQGDTWRRVGETIKPPFKEGRDLADKLGLP
ncbi:MAG: hypothetical protein K1X74_09490 [Pirellulales bacterium]|nr:hypothetical protein [Pirellulales bacterium]